MNPGQMSAVLVLMLAQLCSTSLACPSGCRCYSLTVECGSIGIKEIPQGITQGTQTIFLQDNAIGQIRQRDLSDLGQLHYLYLQNNSISTLEPGAFRSLGLLLELALNGNRIHLITADVFRGLDHLRILYLAGNQINRLEDYTFRGLQRLQELHLQENVLEVLGDQALVGLSSLALLDLSRNNLRTLSPASLKPLVSLQVLRVTDNPWRCDCALHWLRGWINEEGQRLLSSAERRMLCAEPPRLSHLSLVEVPPNSLVCIPPVVQLEPSHLTVRLGESLRVSCQASGYPQPQVTWRKASHGKAQLSPRGLVQEVGMDGDTRNGGRLVTARPGGKGGPSSHGPIRGGADDGADRENFDPDTGSGMLFLSNVTVAHAGRYECEAWNPGGVARVTFHLSVNMSSSSSRSEIWPRLHSSSYYHPSSVDVSQEPLYELESMDFNALGTATQTAIAVGISLLALTALLLLCMIYSRHRQRQKEEGGYGASKEESILYVNDYSDGPTTFAQLEEYRDERGHEMYVLNRAKPVLAPQPMCIQQGSATLKASECQGVLTPGRAGGIGPRRAPAEGGEAPPLDPEGLFMNQSLLFDTQIAYEIHC
uniref:Leucine-rich repeat-containing protein 24 isoform X2 n=1 Tax=Danio rerio TaxID=7955 RepID=A0A8N7TF43_DANRE|nr:leucine-rich repeat-containing protein 24 isoform X2 [Danio rerio]XP_694151.2 leucine-rich repeat-containing protein 24 isoform X2 [Danio rerio]|eukprot:XP_009297159.1 leucine-rich repeat-containing protein 24 isoform X2 [Danio rerio]